MQPTFVILRVLVSLAALTAAAAFAAPASAQLKAGDILVVDPDVPPVSSALLFRVDPETGARTVAYDFGTGSPTAVAADEDGIFVTDTAAGTDPNGGTDEWGALYRLTPDPVTGTLTRSLLSDFGTGTSTGRNPRAVAVAPDGRLLVLNGNGGTGDRAVLVTVDPGTGARAVVSDFGSGAQGLLGIEPRGVAVDAAERLYVIDAQAGTSAFGQLVRVDSATGMRFPVSNFGTGANPGSNPTALAVDGDGQVLVTDEGHPSTTPLGLLFRVDPASGLRSVVSDFNTGANTGREPEGVALESDGQVLVVDKHAGPLTRGMLFRVDAQTGARTILSDFGAGPNQGGDPLAVAVVPATHGTLVVVVHVVNDNGGVRVASEWTVRMTGGNPVPAIFLGAGPPGTSVTLEPGNYSMVVSGPGGYTIAFGDGCRTIITAGVTTTCTVTVDDFRPVLQVGNDVVNDSGGTAVPSDWTIAVTGANALPATFPGPGRSGQSVFFDGGAYSVSASGPAGYGSSLSPGCAGTIAGGTPYPTGCMITLDDIPGTLVVVNRVVNDDGGIATAGDFVVSVSGGDPSPASFTGTGAPGVRVSLDAGGYSVSVAGPRDYTSTLSADCTGTIGLAGTRTCTITSDDAVPTCNGKVATIVGTAGPTRLRGTAGDDVIVDLDGDNVVRGRGGDDTICTGPGDDRILAGAGADTVIDAGGRNTVEGGAGGDAITTGNGDDVIEGGGGTDTITAGRGDNIVEGQGGDDTIATGTGSDQIDGGAAFDTCSPGTGSNTVIRCEVVL